jgi:riboflavin synthase
MFTGIVQNVGLVTEYQKLSNKSVLISVQISTCEQFDTIKIGDSIAINGACLTGVELDNQTKTAKFFVSPESLSITNIKDLSVNSHVNTELAMTMSDKFGGHIVTGHVDCTTKIVEVISDEGCFILKFNIPIAYQKYIVGKGCICIDGISLTINKVFDGFFDVCIIPHTWANTTLKYLDTKDKKDVNIEFDYFTKIVVDNVDRYMSFINK